MLDPEIQPILDVMNAGTRAAGAPRADRRRRARRTTRESAEMSGTGPEVAEVRDVEVPGPGGPIPVRVFRPAGDGAARRSSPTCTAAAG